MKCRKLFVSAMALAMVMSSVSAAEVTAGTQAATEGVEQSVPVALEAEAAVFSVTVPTSLPIHLSAAGDVTLATDAAIVNESGGSIEVTDIALNVSEGWTLKDYDMYETTQVNKQWFGLKINDIKSTADGFEWDNFLLSTKEDGNNTLNLDYDVRVGAQLNGFNGNIASIVCTVGWYLGESAFTIDSADYTVAGGTTWEQWVSSDANVIGASIEEGTDNIKVGDSTYIKLEGTKVTKTDAIEDGAAYVVSAD